MPLRRRALLPSIALLTISTSAAAAPIRPFFEPTDLEFEKPGVLDIDVQTGPTYGANAWGHRWILSDVEVDFGILDNVELGLDAAFSSDLQADHSRTIFSEALWPTVKLGLADFHAGDHAFAFGLQLGPRIPMFTGAGVGYAALGLAGWSIGKVHLVLNGGFVTDPGTTITEGHPTGALMGLDTVINIDDDGHFMLTSELGGTVFTTGRGEAHQTIGLAWEPYTDRLQFSVVFLTGIAANADRGALLFGVSPKMDLF
jgi:hypothetical protein